MESAQDIPITENLRTWTPIFANQQGNTEISYVKFVASYCWFESDQDHWPQEYPTIVVPGCIPILKSELDFPMKAVKADESACVDLNRTQLKHKDLLQPLFLSVKICEPEFQLESMDVISDSSKLRLLIEWCEKPKAFSIDAELLGDHTMVLYAFENRKDYNKHAINSFRKDFHSKATCLPTGWENTFGNYRIISYRYGDLKILVRSPQFVRNTEEEEGAEFPTLFPQTEGTFNGLTFIKSGKIESQENLAKFQYTRPGKSVKMKEKWHKLYFSQIPFMLVAKRNQAVGRTADFESIETLSSADDFQCATLDAKKQRNRLLQMLHEMRKILREERENGYSKLTFKFSKGTGSVEVFTCTFPSQLEGWDHEVTLDQ